MKNLKITATLLSLTLLFSLAGCKKEVPEETPATSATTTAEETTTTTTEETTTTESSETTLEDPLYDPSLDTLVNPVTGIQDMDAENDGLRSIAIVINNCHAALPQRGISQADAIYEYETEGGQTRLLALFADLNTIPEMGSLRSARIIATDLAAGNDSIFIHYGRNPRVPDHIAQFGIDHIDGNNCSAGSNSSANAADGYVSLPSGLFFWRDSTWLSQRALEHTAVTDGTHIAEAIEHFGISRDIVPDEEDPDYNGRLFNFVADDSADIASGEPCTEVNVYLSAMNDDALFTYDPETGLYFKEEYGAPQIDQTNDEQISFTNVFIFYANIQGHGDGTIDAYLEDGGTGWYFSDGMMVPITWEKESPNDPIIVYNLDGEELEVNRGRSYMCMVDNDRIGMSTYRADAEAEMQNLPGEADEA